MVMIIIIDKYGYKVLLEDALKYSAKEKELCYYQDIRYLKRTVSYDSGNGRSMRAKSNWDRY